jgi:hypothetical protein
VEEDSEQHLLLGLKEVPARFLPELPEQFLGEVLEPELVEAAAKRTGVLRPEHAEERPTLLEKPIHRRTQSVGLNRLEFLEPALDGGITAGVRVELEPVGPRWHRHWNYHENHRPKETHQWS